MPQLQLVTEGLANLGGQRNLVGLPSIEALAIDIIAINVMRGNGLEVDANNNYMVGLSHQTDMPVQADEDDFVGSILDNDIWWVANLSPESSVFDVLPEPISVAGPQTFAIFNNLGQTTACRLILWYRSRRISLREWTQLKTLTSYEGVA